MIDPERLLRDPLELLANRLARYHSDNMLEKVSNGYMLNVVGVLTEHGPIPFLAALELPLDRAEAHAAVDLLYDYGASDCDGKGLRLELYHSEMEYHRSLSSHMPPPKPPSKPKPGFVYVMWDEAAPAHKKIGWTIHVPRRIGTISSEKKIQNAGFFYVRSDDAPKLERLMHKYYAFFRVNGEWFNLPGMNFGKFTAAILEAGSSFHPPANDDFTAKHVYMEEASSNG